MAFECASDLTFCPLFFKAIFFRDFEVFTRSFGCNYEAVYNEISVNWNLYSLNPWPYHRNLAAKAEIAAKQKKKNLHEL
jgi:hypothetical protein